jgi:hypothetical protein
MVSAGLYAALRVGRQKPGNQVLVDVSRVQTMVDEPPTEMVDQAERVGRITRPVSALSKLIGVQVDNFCKRPRPQPAKKPAAT